MLTLSHLIEFRLKNEAVKNIEIVGINELQLMSISFDLFQKSGHFKSINNLDLSIRMQMAHVY